MISHVLFSYPRWFIRVTFHNLPWLLILLNILYYRPLGHGKKKTFLVTIFFVIPRNKGNTIFRFNIVRCLLHSEVKLDAFGFDASNLTPECNEHITILNLNIVFPLLHGITKKNVTEKKFIFFLPCHSGRWYNISNNIDTQGR